MTDVVEPGPPPSALSKGSPLRRWLPWALLAVVVVAALSVAVYGSRSAPTAEDRVADVARTVKCPTCSGESVAESNAPASQAIRAEIAEQHPERPDRRRDPVLSTPRPTARPSCSRRRPRGSTPWSGCCRWSRSPSPSASSSSSSGGGAARPPSTPPRPIGRWWPRPSSASTSRPPPTRTRSVKGRPGEHHRPDRTQGAPRRGKAAPIGPGPRPAQGARQSDARGQGAEVGTHRRSGPRASSTPTPSWPSRRSATSSCARSTTSSANTTPATSTTTTTRSLKDDYTARAANVLRAIDDRRDARHLGRRGALVDAHRRRPAARGRAGRRRRLVRLPRRRHPGPGPGPQRRPPPGQRQPRAPGPAGHRPGPDRPAERRRRRRPRPLPDRARALLDRPWSSRPATSRP